MHPWLPGSACRAFQKFDLAGFVSPPQGDEQRCVNPDDDENGQADDERDLTGIHAEDSIGRLISDK
jgi:hypothetical protein